MAKIITDFVVKDAQKGQAVRLFYREDGATKFVDVNIPRLFVSSRSTYADAQKRLDYLLKDDKIASLGVTAEIKASGKQSVIHLRGPREIKKFLPKHIFGSPGTAEQIIEYVDVPLYSEVEIQDNKVKILGAPDPHRLKDERMLCFDLETDQEGRRDGNYTRINTAAVKSGDLESIISIMTNVKDQRELAFQLSELILENDPAIIGNHNLFYDISKSGELGRKTKTEEIFPIGADETKPYIHAFLGFFKMPRVNGRILLDSMNFAQNWGWSRNNKLETVCNFLGIDFEKSLNYGELEDLVEKWEREGDSDAIRIIHTYAKQDVESTLELLEKLREDIFDLAWLFETRIDNISYVSKLSLAMGLRTRRRFEKLNDIRRSIRHELEDFDIDKVKINLLKGNGFSLASERGYFSTRDIYAVYTSFLSNALKPIIKNDKTFKFVYDIILSKKTPESKIIFQQAVDAFCEELIFDLSSKRTEGQVFKAIYGATKDEVRRDLFDTITRMHQFIDKNDLEIVNYTSKFLFVRPKKHKQGIEKLLESHPNFTIYGRADRVISGHSGNMIALMENGVLITPGTINMDANTKKGHRTPFERQTIEQFGTLLLYKGYETALNYLEERCSDLANGKIPRKDLLFELRARRDWRSYVDQDSERGQAIQQFKLQDEEKVSYGRIAEGRLLEKAFLESNAPIDLEWYQEKFFGGYREAGSREFHKGTIGDIAYSVLADRGKEQKLALQNILEGTSEATDIEFLIRGNKVKNASQRDLWEYV